MKSRIISALFVAAILITLSATRSPLAASNSGAVIPRSTGSDIFVSDQSSAQLFQAPDTPGIDEMKSDVVASCDGVSLPAIHSRVLSTRVAMISSRRK